jgi:hypothetical protein
MLPDPDIELPLTSEELEIWNEILTRRPQFEAAHTEDCPGITVTLHAHRDSCLTCREWLAEVLRENRRLKGEDRRLH